MVKRNKIGQKLAKMSKMVKNGKNYQNGKKQQK